MDIILTLAFFALVGFFLYKMDIFMGRTKKAAELIARYYGDAENPALIDEIFEYAQKDRILSRIVREHSATREDFADIYRKLLLWGGFKKGRRFIPIDSFFYAWTIRYLLEHKGEDAKALTMKMMNYFKI